MKTLSKYIFMLVLGFSQIGPAWARSDIKLEIGSTLPRKYLSKEINLTPTAAANLRPYIKVTIKRVDYLVAYEEDTRKIKYIYTDDEDFRSVGGTNVDDEITVLWNDIELLGYFQVRAPADKDGWQPVIGEFSAFEGPYLDNIRKAGKVTTEIDGFAKGYN